MVAVESHLKGHISNWSNSPRTFFASCSLIQAKGRTGIDYCCHCSRKFINSVRANVQEEGHVPNDTSCMSSLVCLPTYLTTGINKCGPRAKIELPHRWEIRQTGGKNAVSIASNLFNEKSKNWLEEHSYLYKLWVLHMKNLSTICTPQFIKYLTKYTTQMYHKVRRM